MDLLEKMAEHDLVHVVRKVFARLTFLDVFNCRRTCNRWDSIVRQMVMSRWSEGQRCKYGWLTQPLRLEKVDLSAFLGDSPGVGGPARKVEVVLGEGDLRRKREVEVETTLLASVDLTSFCVVKQFLGLPGWQAEVGVFVGGHLSAVVKPSVPEEVAREVRFHVSFDDLVVTRRLVLIHGQVAMPRGHPIRSKDLLWVFDRSGGGMGEVGRHVLTEGLGNTTCFHFVKARDLVRVLSIVEDGLSAILSVRTINSLTGEPELTKCCSLPMLPYYNLDWLLESATCRFVSLAHRTQTRLVLQIVSLFTARPTRHVDLPNAFDDVNLGRDDRRVVAVTLAGEDKVVTLTDSWREGVAVRVEDAESGAEERVIRIDEAVLVDGSYINAVANERILNCHLVCNVGSRCLLFLLGRPRRWQLYFDVETGAFSKLDDRYRQGSSTRPKIKLKISNSFAEQSSSLH